MNRLCASALLVAALGDLQLLACARVPPPEPGAIPNGARVTYDFFVSRDDGKPYSHLEEIGGVRYALQFPGRSPHDAALYGDVFVLHLWAASEEIAFSLNEVEPAIESPSGARIAYSRLRVLVKDQPSKRVTVLAPTRARATRHAVPLGAGILLGYSFEVPAVETLPEALLHLSFAIESGSAARRIRHNYALRLSSRTETYHACKDRGQDVLIGPWWLLSPEQGSEYESVTGAEPTDSRASKRLRGKGFLPRLAYDNIHFEGFFLHWDGEN